MCATVLLKRTSSVVRVEAMVGTSSLNPASIFRSLYLFRPSPSFFRTFVTSLPRTFVTSLHSFFVALFASLSFTWVFF